MVLLLGVSCSLQQHTFLSSVVTGSVKNSKLGVWRFSRLEVAVENDPGKDCYDISPGLLQVLSKRIGCKSAHLSRDALSVVRKSFDARRVIEPRFVYTVDLNVTRLVSEQPRSWSFLSRMKQDPGVVEFLKRGAAAMDLVEMAQLGGKGFPSHHSSKTRVLVVGSGPAGLFAALALAEMGVQVTLVERGYPVETRGRHIGSLMVRRILKEDSNFCYGEGGAGTWSDGKLTTRIGKNSEDVQTVVLKTLVRFGASDGILVEGKPHIGTDKLVHILRGLRNHLKTLGVSLLMFGTRMEDIVIRNGRVSGIQVTDLEKTTTATLSCDALVLAVGHSARNTYEMLLSHGVLLSAKDFAVGLRVEHPQELVNQMRYRAWASQVQSGKGKVPVADYKVAASINSDELRSCYSFCMCPGGQIVPTSTDPLHLCINGMSFSKRASKWANAALVVNVTSKDVEPFRDGHGSLAGVAFQRAIERDAALLGGGDFVVPAQTLKDFLDDKIAGNELPTSSYRLGVREAPLHELLPGYLTAVLKNATEKFNQQLHGFIDSRALLHGVETRTSSPVRIERHAETCESVSIQGLYPVGEGAGYAGGIVSAAVDGMKAGLSLGRRLLETTVG
ncbi:hypothetical protein SELMODRAFT_99389 [Selaginella moellendorffii]|uniref:Uncharacterized protein n=1 Tax=Selaginella moellendorffii TaxID=88036 RepID=D8RQS4_SELML|nr:hypothetical protein SELMODRAFT_99389 [Selaginella moellendorffii]